MAKAIVVQTSRPPTFRQFLRDYGSQLGVHVIEAMGARFEFSYTGLEFVVGMDEVGLGEEVMIHTQIPIKEVPPQIESLIEAYNLELSKWAGAPDPTISVKYAYKLGS